MTYGTTPDGGWMQYFIRADCRASCWRQFLGIAYCRFCVAIPELVRLDDGVPFAALGRTIQRYLDGPLDEASGLLK